MHKQMVLSACLLVLVCGVVSGRAGAQQSCDDSDPCTELDACQLDGTCHGTALPNGSPCVPVLFGGCATSGTCLTQFGFSLCMPDQQTIADPGTPCTIPGVDATFLGGCGTMECQEDGSCGIVPIKSAGDPCSIPAIAACTTSMTCDDDGICVPQPKVCPTPADKCTLGFCNPSNGACETVPNTCVGECATCDPSSGMCTLAPKPNGTACDDGKLCTTNDHCTGGICAGAVGAPTFTPTATRTNTLGVVPTSTPTRTATSAPSSTPTQVPASSTPTRTLTPVSTPSHTQSPSATQAPVNTATPSRTATTVPSNTPADTPTHTPTHTLAIGPTSTPTIPPTETPLPPATATPTQPATATPTTAATTEPTPVPSLTPTPLSSPTVTQSPSPPPIPCTGDCDGSGDVTVNEIIAMVNIALGSAEVSTCAVGDADGSGDITVNEIVKAVGLALANCPGVAA
jgi:hypothetical protein